MRTLVTFLLTLLAASALSAQERLDSAGIDRLIDARLSAEGVAAAPPADDSEFLRRLSLDTRGTIPSVEETIAFLADRSPEKRAEAIERFLADPKRGEAWGAYWDKVLIGNFEGANNQMVRMGAKSLFREWVAEQFNQNTPYDKFAEAIITAEGQVRESPQGLPTLRYRESVADLSGSMTRVFLGKQVQCAQCHNHPYDENLTQQDFWELAAFFDRTKARPVRDENGRFAGFNISEVPRGRTFIPDTSPRVEVQPVWLDGTKGPIGLAAQRRESYVTMLTYHDREQFARNMANRLWAHYFGRGLVEPVDDWQNPYATPSHPELMEALATEFLAADLDIRHLERLVLNTRTYQRGSTADAVQRARADLFAAAPLRPLTPDQLFNSIDAATNLSSLAANRPAAAAFPDALRLRYLAQFTFLFDNDEMEEVDTFEPNLSQALFMLNDKTLAQAVSNRGGSMIAEIIETTKDPGEQVAYLFLAALSRRPSAEEAGAYAELLRSAAGTQRNRALEDILWVLVNSAEFRTNH
ncbi:MAG: DUF1549 domain-containing protein [Candidatus Sumerlaeia bacterium]|nr:DUF1549 domain-containing protein [Candidatus Sumerlaeia bacterium]